MTFRCFTDTSPWATLNNDEFSYSLSALTPSITLDGTGGFSSDTYSFLPDPKTTVTFEEEVNEEDLVNRYIIPEKEQCLLICLESGNVEDFCHHKTIRKCMYNEHERVGFIGKRYELDESYHDYLFFKLPKSDEKWTHIGVHYETIRYKSKK